jgi:hypothetical protein
MAKHHGGTHHIQGTLNRGTVPRPSPTHAGSGRPKGILHAAPTKPMINSANYGAQKIRRK